MQDVYAYSLDENFCSTLTGLIGHLCRQQSLISELRKTHPRVATTRWLSISSVTEWLTEHHIRINQHFDERKPPCASSQEWWISMFAVHASSAVFPSFEGMTTLLSEQRQRLEGLVDTFCHMFGMPGPLDSDQAQKILIEQAVKVCRSFVPTYESANSRMN